MVYGVQGSFDSVNPFIVKGAPAAGVNTLVFDTLMRRSANEPFTYYPLVAATIETPEDRSWVEFRIDPRARFSDGKPITAEDVAFSLDLLRNHGRPNTRASYAKVTKVEVKDERTIRFQLGTGADREMPLILATMVVLPKHAIDPTTFEQSTLKPMIGSGPYVFGEIRAGQSVAFKRNPDWWARDLPSNRGLYNFDEVRYDYYRDASSMFEAFKSGLYDVRPEGDAGRWATQYVFPALRDGRVVKEEIPNGLPKGMNAFVFNTRRPIFQDARLREALGLLFDFEWANKNLFYGLYVRTCSFFEGSELSSCGRPADRARAPASGGLPGRRFRGRARGTMGAAASRTARAATGPSRARPSRCSRTPGGRSRTASMRQVSTGTPLAFQILVLNSEQERLAVNYAESLKRLGIVADVRLIDDVQYRKRQQTFDFDMIQFRWPASLSPGNEQNFRWSTQAADAQGSFNYAGVRNPAVDAMIAAMNASRSREDFVSAVRALDRVLISGHYVLPLYASPTDWLARWHDIDRPDKPALIGAPVETFWSRPQ